ncbi:MAG: choice-of-anchor J domain-containing protein, partial [Prevotellaceae bacterium]|nr:choice-of-anchor J domain-containing protein [Prevotellaceae bacterium]
NKTCLPSESWLISPEIDLANRVSARMIINHAVNNCATPTKYLSVKVSTDNKTWDNVEVSPWPAGNSWDYNNAEGSLDKYVGKKIHVAFVYTSDSNYAPTWEIKTFEVIGEAAQYGLPGDADGDGVVTVSDITAIAAYILGNTPANFNAANADVDGDGQITVSDITATAAIILGTK